ncbi:hypothetical protein TOT_030000827 [Theileria orientalis strain Shintoku]|uniref:Uncharacterized protein n=1 Tax=Theileria orientalis strain Shintoku TaxID=869250 RepID=J4DPZ5_THEOR|nr:hypothetical protein TOT_030000827 [Theileria orientalis strain Shintoku]BAM41564.1 hypothetical protein TOT_030000827 [Theileria orientalis strain Shintoku]|eukprot:XP_009691865.1 hypothetical protein TOT_030000827 [Theileria orientalis strain Shintoku]
MLEISMIFGHLDHFKPSLVGRYHVTHGHGEMTILLTIGWKHGHSLDSANDVKTSILKQTNNHKVEVSLERGEEADALYIETFHITNYKEDNYTYNKGETIIRLSREPNDLFVRYEITNIRKIRKIIYYIDKEPKTFNLFPFELNNREMDHILVYFIRYNETPLYLSIFLKNNGNVSEDGIKDMRINYKLDKSGVWKKAEHLAYVFNDLKELAYKHDMFQFFELEKSDKDFLKSDTPVKYPISKIEEHTNEEFKYYTHTSNAKNGITSLFLYRKKIIKSLIIIDKYINRIDVYYDKEDKQNRLPLLIIIYKSGEEKEYYVNEGGNYRWKRQDKLLGYKENNSFLLLTLQHLKGQLMGKVKEIGIGEEFEEAAVSQIDHDGLNVLIQDHHELGYRCLSYSDEGRRFTISKLNCSEAPINISDLPFYSVLGFYVFHHGSSTSPLFLCAVYEVKHDKIFVWYQLTKRDGFDYEICYFLSEDPRLFTNFKPIINMIEAKIYNLNVELVTTLNKSYNYGRETLTNVGEINFNVTYQRRHPTHNRYIMSPANSNYFSINYISVYGTKFENVKFKSVKEIHVFEHSNMHHYKVCISAAEYNFSSESDSIDFHWYEIRKNTNKGNGWTIVGKPKIKMTPDDFDTPQNIASLMDERIYFSEESKDVVYRKPSNEYVEPKLNIKYDTPPTVPYLSGGTWPPIEPEFPDGYGKLYSTYEFDEEKNTIRGTTLGMPGKIGGITPLVGGLLGSGAGVGIVGVTTGYVLYSNIGTITSALGTLLH